MEKCGDDFDLMYVFLVVQKLYGKSVPWINSSAFWLIRILVYAATLVWIVAQLRMDKISWKELWNDLGCKIIMVIYVMMIIVLSVI